MNNLVVFCQTNHFRVLGVICLFMAVFILLTWVSFNLLKKFKTLAVGVAYISSVVMFLSKVLMWIWLLMELVVILNKILIF